MIIALVLASAVLMALFLFAALAGGRAHDRQNALHEQARRAKSQDPARTVPSKNEPDDRFQGDD